MIRDIREIEYLWLLKLFFSRDILYPRHLVPQSRDSNRDFRDIKYPRHFLPLEYVFFSNPNAV